MTNIIKNNSQIDWACITSIIDLLDCNDLKSPGEVVRNAALTATIPLMTEREMIHLAPPPQKPGVSRGAFDYILTGLRSRIYTPEIASEIQDEALADTKKWVVDNSTAIREDFNKMWADDDFKQWLDLEVRNIWLPHAATRKGLFDLTHDSLIAEVTGVNKSDLQKLYKISCDFNKITELQKMYSSSQKHEDMHRAYVGSFVVRTTYYDSIADKTNRKIAHHELRKSYRSFLPNTVSQRKTEEIEKGHLYYYLACAILAAAQKETNQENKIAYFSQYVTSINSKIFSGELRLPYVNDPGMDAIERWLYDMASVIPFHTTNEETRKIIQRVIELIPALIFLLIDSEAFKSYIAIADPILRLTNTTNKIADLVISSLDTQERVCDFLKDLPPGRFDFEWKHIG